ncbi:hypothetical protein DER29_2862 [Micromonospora sp. M71_S20]|uniref:hypothetical protein n=1 Tax=Micromonospora sp. M71_S20 TaxID=592872 RepID=UPI000F2C9803|nr:hypothetical protein [Micromonospora sp. M71_S20]RLK24898.1 hypothetical protein DER29_2862 [Micromonospora sp. M71_S20]
MAAIAAGTTKIVYTLNGGRIFEAASNAGWRNLNSGVRGATAAVLAVGNNKYIYAA